MSDVQVVLVGTPGPAGAGLGTHEALANNLVHIRVVTSSTRPLPALADKGVVIFEEDTNLFFIWDGAAWQELFQWLNKFRGAQVYRSAALSLTTAIDTLIPWDTEAGGFDTDAFHDNVTNNTRITVPAGLGGYYRITASLEFAANATGFRQVTIWKNGIADGAVSATPQGTQPAMFSVTKVLNLAAGDFLEVKGIQTSGAALNVQATSRTFFEVQRLGV